MNLYKYLLILILEQIFSSSIVVIPFEINKIKFSNKKYSAIELINLLYTVEIYTPIELGAEKQKYFGIISLSDHHPMLTESNCEKMKLFQNNKNIIKKGYKVSESSSSKYLGNVTDYLNSIKFVEFYSEYFSYFNTTLIEQYKNNNSEIGEIIFVRNNTIKENNEMCLSIGLSEYYRVFASYKPPHFLDDLHSKRKTKTEDWTFKFTDLYSGYLIIGDLPHNYENDTMKYSENNYRKSNSKSIVTFFRPWAIEMQEIYFNNSKNEHISVNKNENKLTIVHDYGFIIGSNNYKQLIYENYFENLINKKICELESSEKIIEKDHIDTDGSFSMFICDKRKIDIKTFPSLYFKHYDYEYIFSMTYKDLFLAINNYYYFMIIFPNNQTGKSIQENWYIGLPFLTKYQFILNFDYKSIGFYKFKNFDEEPVHANNTKNKKLSKFIIYSIQILAIIILIIISIFIGMFLKKQRKKRANELKDDDYEYYSEKENKDNKNNEIIN